MHRLRLTLTLNTPLRLQHSSALGVSFWFHRRFDFHLRQNLRRSFGQMYEKSRPPYGLLPMTADIETLEIKYGTLVIDLLLGAYAEEDLFDAFWQALWLWAADAQPTCKLTCIQALSPTALPEDLFKTDDDRYAFGADPPTPLTEAQFAAQPPAPANLLICWITPVIIDTSARRKEGKPIAPLTARRLLSAARDRIQTMTPHFFTHALAHPNVQTLEAQAELGDASGAFSATACTLSRVDYRSTTHQTPIPLEGWQGYCVWNNASSATVSLLRLASWMGVGSRTNLGFGNFILNP
jgi:hypothetical protein